METQNKKEALVVHYFLTLVDNSVKNIAKTLEISEHRVHVVINKYLKNKTIGNA